MKKTTVKLNICGNDYIITTDEDEKYVRELGDELDSRLSEIMRQPRISMTQAAILCALDYADKAKKSEDGTENLRATIKDYLEDAAQSQVEAQNAKKKVGELEEELKALRKNSPPMKSF